MLVLLRGAASFLYCILICILAVNSHNDIQDHPVQDLRHFGTKTTYNKRIPDASSVLPWKPKNIPKNLRVIHIDAILRHGTRFPSTKRINIWRKLVPTFQTAIAQSNSLEFSPGFKKSISNWTCQFPDHSSYLLSSLGWKEHVDLAQKYYSMMPDLWTHTMDKLHMGLNEHLRVFSSSKIRSLTSARAFVTSLQLAIDGVMDLEHEDLQFDEAKCLREHNKVDEETGSIVYNNISVKIDDDILRFFDNCKKYLISVDNNDTAEHELENFFESDTFQRIRERIPEIGNGKLFFYIYQLCAFEMAIYGNSVWCRLFSEEDLTKLEYASDLKHYYRTGHGYAVNYEQACVLLESIMGNMTGLQSRKRFAVLRFGHAETLIPIMSLLGLYQDSEQLKFDNFDRQEDRAFRTGRISPFAGNFAIVVYESKQKDLFISFVVNENIVMPFGMNCFFCNFGPYSEVRQLMEKKIENCHLACRVEVDSGESSSGKSEL